MPAKKELTLVVTAEQMQQLEDKLFAHQMPVPSLMEKAALLTSQKIQSLYPLNVYPQVGVLVGCGHNGGDGLVIARELWLQGYQVLLYTPLASKSKKLTAQHLVYNQFLGLPTITSIDRLYNCDVIIDSLFGFGLTRSITGKLAQEIHTINEWQIPVVSIDLPSGIDTNTGNVLGTAIKATQTICLGLWKIGLFQGSALEYVGGLHLIDIGIVPHLISQHQFETELMTATQAQKILPLPRDLNTHKYHQGNVALICGSTKFTGAALLAGLGANSGGVGMLTAIVPRSIKLLINSHLPNALVIGTPETETGAIEGLNLTTFDLPKYEVIGFGMGITRQITPTMSQDFAQLLNQDNILLIDADGLNLLAENDFLERLSQRQAPTILTPHEGEFKRLFPDIDLQTNRLQGLKNAACRTNSIILLKGAKTMICEQGKKTWIITQSTPALARGGSGDILSGLICALVAQGNYNLYSIGDMVALSAWLHQQAGILAAQDYSQMGVDGFVLAKYITKTVASLSKVELEET